MLNPNLLCLDSISFPCWLDLIRSSLMTRSNYFPSVYLSEFILIPYSLFLLIIHTSMFFPSPPLERWWKTLPTIWLRILLVRPRLHAKYSKTIYLNIPGSCNYSGLFKVHILTNSCTWSRITLSAFWVELNKICIRPHIQYQSATPPPPPLP